jgi:hypothetical protein
MLYKSTCITTAGAHPLRRRFITGGKVLVIHAAMFTENRRQVFIYSSLLWRKARKTPIITIMLPWVFRFIYSYRQSNVNWSSNTCVQLERKTMFPYSRFMYRYNRASKGTEASVNDQQHHSVDCIVESKKCASKLEETINIYGVLVRKTLEKRSLKGP